MKKYTKYFQLTLVVFLILLFLVLRFYNINNSFFFFNDIGRDFRILQLWQSSKKPPLLGPQNSVLPFNQSAIYFYYLYPFYILSKSSPFCTLFANSFLYITSFIFSLYFFRKNEKIKTLIFTLFFLISIHPLYIIQSRSVWNPSLTTPFIIASFIFYYLLFQQYSRSKLFFFSLSISIAISLSYSIAPLLIAYFFYWLFFNRQRFLSFFFSIIFGFILANFPTLVFELRHNFLLSKSFFTKTTTLQENLTLIEKFNNLSNYIFSISNQNINYFLLIILIFSLLFIIIRNIKNKKDLSFISAFLLIVLIILHLILPITLREHYIFALTSLFFIFVYSLPLKIKTLFFVIISLIFLSPNRLNTYFQRAPRNYEELNSCFRSYCQKQTQPINVSVTSIYHPYHNGPEHRYLLEKNGCLVKELEKGEEANLMALVIDGGSFDPLRSTFYELDLFGSFKVKEKHYCQSNLQIIDLVSTAIK